MNPTPGLRKMPLSEVAARVAPAPDMVTVVIEHLPQPAHLAQYELWLAQTIPIASRFPGHRGVHVIKPTNGSGKYTVMLRFDDLATAQDWLMSDARRELIAQVEPLLVAGEEIRTVTGIEFWFTPPAAAERRAPRYKQFLVALSVIYPLTLLVPWALGPLLRGLGPDLRLLAHLLDVGSVVFLMTYVVMPRYTARIAGWLYR